MTESQLHDASTGATGYNPGEIRIIKLPQRFGFARALSRDRPEAHRYEYSVLDGQLHLKNHISSLSMHVIDAFRTEVTWESSFEPAGAPGDALAEGVRSSVLELGLQGLEERMRKAA